MAKLLRAMGIAALIVGIPILIFYVLISLPSAVGLTILIVLLVLLIWVMVTVPIYTGAKW